MFAAFSRLAGIAVLILVLAACTRERPTPEPAAMPATAADTAPETPTPEPPPDQQDTTGEPRVTEASTPTAQETPTAEPTSDESFQYTVQPGDTLSTIAEKFGTDMETIRRMNRLTSDEVYVGQPLLVPYVEDMTAEGLPTATPGPYYYTIQPGDTLSLIAQQFDVDQITIMEANNLLNPDNLIVGTTILIPGYQPPTIAEADEDSEDTASTGTTDGSGRVIHQVRPGEGLYQIAERYGVAATEIAAANGITLDDLLNVGQELVIPGITEEEATLARSIIHVVRAGENLFGIAVRYGVTVEELLEANDIDNPDSISIGQRLLIPTN